MADQAVVVQASSTSWSGSPDMCMNLVGGVPVVSWTIRKLLNDIPNARVIVAAPESDALGAFTAIAQSFPAGAVSVYFGHDANPLARLVACTAALDDDALILRVDGLHMFADTGASRDMLRLAACDTLDCVKLPDDFPAQFTSDVYRVGALRRAAAMLPPGEAGDVFRVHPKFFMFQHPDAFRCRYLPDPPQYDDRTLFEARETAREIYRSPREDVNGRRQWSGDQLGFHYELARPRLARHMKVLDLACGTGHGLRLVADAVREAHGGDADPAVIEQARAATAAPNVSFHVLDALATGFPDASFDAVLSMETVEHVDGERFLDELHRLMTPGALLVMSTPQNSQGRIPITATHEREYTLEQAVDLVARRFTIHEVIGLKQGRIVIPGDPRGQNTVIVAVKGESKRI
jgi:2-polyprenyl-3-methyl-5-hydroxy-6-metoxy-1,4-benzoquinol methylase/spore coat polysaccharide biosynthesis protein SpsF (cytidylyltransferase family)